MSAECKQQFAKNGDLWPTIRLHVGEYLMPITYASVSLVDSAFICVITAVCVFAELNEVKND